MGSEAYRPVSAEQQAAERAHAKATQAWASDMSSEVPASQLDAAQKQSVWAHLKAHHPERVAFLQDDAIKALMASSGAVPTFPADIVRAALQPSKRS